MTTDRVHNVFFGSARFVGKLQHTRKLPKFNFKKYISYLDKVSRNVGFSIGVVLVTWELVSIVFFFLISLIALFLQESMPYFRGTQRIVSVEYLFGRPVIASNFRLGKCHLELSYRLDFRRFLESGLRGEERGLISRTAAGYRA